MAELSCGSSERLSSKHRQNFSIIVNSTTLLRSSDARISAEGAIRDRDIKLSCKNQGLLPVLWLSISGPVPDSRLLQVE